MFVREYCDYYKFFLVEELVLAYPEKFHYGLCSAIGQLSLSKDNRIQLSNLNISSLDQKYTLDDGDIQLKLIWSDCEQTPAYNEALEVFGEAVLLCKNAKPVDKYSHLSIKYANVRFIDTDTATQFEPAMKVHSYRIVTQVDRLIRSNLQLRLCSR